MEEREVAVQPRAAEKEAAERRRSWQDKAKKSADKPAPDC